MAKNLNVVTPLGRFLIPTYSNRLVFVSFLKKKKKKKRTRLFRRTRGAFQCLIVRSECIGSSKLNTLQSYRANLLQVFHECFAAQE